MNTLEDISMHQQYFWDLADETKLAEQYRIDSKLQSLQMAPLSALKKIFIQYRFFTHFYITDLALLISKLPFGGLKSILAEILYDELGMGDMNKAHPKLYDAFLKSIGVTEAEMQIANPKCFLGLETIQKTLIQKSWAYAIGLRGMGGECLCQIYLTTMHQYFSKNLSIIAIQDQIDWEFWHIHIGEVDQHHQVIVRAAIDEIMTNQPHIISDLTQGYLESKTAWDYFWKENFRAAEHTLEPIS